MKLILVHTTVMYACRKAGSSSRLTSVREPEEALCRS